MNFNKRISKFLAAMAIGFCTISNFNCYISGMEVEKKFPNSKAIVDDLSREFLKLVKTQSDFVCCWYIE